MAKVILRNHWFAPNGQLFRRSDTKKGPPREIPDSMVYAEDGRSQLPTSALIMPDDYVTDVSVQSADTISEHRKMMDANDPMKMAALAQAKVLAEAEENRLEQKELNRIKFEAELAAEKQTEKDRLVAVEMKAKAAKSEKGK